MKFPARSHMSAGAFAFVLRDFNNGEKEENNNK